MVHLDLLIEAGDDPQAAVAELDEDSVQLAHRAQREGTRVPGRVRREPRRGTLPGWRHGDLMPFPPESRTGTWTRLPTTSARSAACSTSRRRARATGFVLAHAQDYGGKMTFKMSKFVVEALDLPPAPQAFLKTAAPAEAIHRHAPRRRDAAVLPLHARPRQPLRLSHGQIDDFLTCPLKCRYAHVVQVPLGFDPRAMYGIAMHHAIRIYLQHRLKGPPIRRRT